MQITTIGLDLAKSVFQVHGVDREGKACLKRRLRRAEVIAFFADLPPCLIGLEACPSAHFWGRELQQLGHDVRLIPPAYVKPYVRRQKNDMVDAAAICEAVSRPSMRFVPIKSSAQQAALLAHRGRSLLLRQRTALINALRAHCAEFGVVFVGRRTGLAAMLAAIRDEADSFPEAARPVLTILADQLRALQTTIAVMEVEALRVAKVDERVRNLMTIPGIGPIGATALAATIPDAKAFTSGREFAAWLGLTPLQRSSGGKERLGKISKMGDVYIRRLLVSGAQAVLSHAKRRPDFGETWLGQMVARKHRNVVAVALANKTARIAWAGMARGETYAAPA